MQFAKAAVAVDDYNTQHNVELVTQLELLPCQSNYRCSRKWVGDKEITASLLFNNAKDC